MMDEHKLMYLESRRLFKPKSEVSSDLSSIPKEYPDYQCSVLVGGDLINAKRYSKRNQLIPLQTCCISPEKTLIYLVCLEKERIVRKYLEQNNNKLNITAIHNIIYKLELKCRECKSKESFKNEMEPNEFASTILCSLKSQPDFDYIMCLASLYKTSVLKIGGPVSFYYQAKSIYIDQYGTKHVSLSSTNIVIVYSPSKIIVTDSQSLYKYIPENLSGNLTECLTTWPTFQQL